MESQTQAPLSQGREIAVVGKLSRLVENPDVLTGETYSH